MRWVRRCGRRSVRMPNRTRAEQVARLRAAIKRSGLSNRQYAETVLMRDERTVRRWLAGKQAMPAVVVRSLEAVQARTPVPGPRTADRDT